MVAHTRQPTLTPALAQEIASETSTIIGLNVLITDREAVVIGSGDVSRVGSVHEASLEVLDTLRPATHTAEQARRLRGVLPGITLPIVIDGTALGTVGLTGSPRRVRQFGLVVQRQTEILLQESILVRSRLLREQAVEDLVRDIAVFDPDIVEPAALAAVAAEQGIDLGLPRAAVLVSVPVVGPTIRGVLPQTSSPARTIRDVFHDPQDMLAELTAGRFALLHHASNTSSLRDKCTRLVDLLAERHAVVAHIGYGPVARDVTGLHGSYLDATVASRIGPRLRPTIQVFPVEELRVPQLLDATAHLTRVQYVRSQLGALPADDGWPALRETVIAWCESGFNLVRAAQRLQVHRNTLIYRLDKITRLTRSRVREPVDGVALYLACLAERLDPSS
jgi:carbohydrate diacid regulator